jgi:ParB/RepB/Spo0J family partition protein
MTLAKGKLKYVKLSDIILDERYRKDMGNIEDLAASIEEKGILQPITLDSNLHLLAGGRRHAAAQHLGLKEIPALIRDIDGELDAREIELVENINRKQFTWQEEAKLVQEIDRLYKEKDGNWSGRKTAELLEKSVGGVSMAISLARAMEALPELEECKTADDARKLLKGLEEKAIVTELRRRQEANVTAQAETDKGAGSAAQGVDNAVARMIALASNNYMISDVFEGLASLPSNGHIDFIECDPPYAVDLNESKRGNEEVNSTAKTYKEISKEDYPEFLEKLASELFRVSGRNSWCAFWFGQSWFTEVKAALIKAGWLVDDIPNIWVKNTGQSQQPELYLGRAWEPFFICRKGKPVLASRGRLNTFIFPGCPTSGADRKYHPTQRPLPLIDEILATYTVGMQNVLVPFLGSGATLRAAYNRGLTAYGFDANAEYKDRFLLAVEEDTRALYASSKDED